MTPSERNAQRAGWTCVRRGAEAWWFHPRLGSIRRCGRWWVWVPGPSWKAEEFMSLWAAVSWAGGRRVDG